MDELQSHIYFSNARQMFWTVDKIADTHDMDKIRELELEAAGYADSVIDGITLLHRGSSREMLNLGEGKSVSFKKMENEAYRLLARRAEISPNNVFNDTGARWFS